jgi:hypothetical protein
MKKPLSDERAIRGRVIAMAAAAVISFSRQGFSGLQLVVVQGVARSESLGK